MTLSLFMDIKYIQGVKYWPMLAHLACVPESKIGIYMYIIISTETDTKHITCTRFIRAIDNSVKEGFYNFNWSLAIVAGTKNPNDYTKQTFKCKKRRNAFEHI